MTEQKNLEGLTRTELDKYKSLAKERRGYFMINVLAYPVIINFEVAYVRSMLTPEDPQMQNSDIAFASIMGIVLLGTVINYALNIIDDRHIFKEMKTLEQKMTSEQKEQLYGKNS